MFHTAHWVGTPLAAEASSVVDAHLAGDFLAAPFGTSDLINDPPHGWSANSSWHLISRTETEDHARMKLALERPVMGAKITKQITLYADQPVLYQRHEITGGAGGLTFAHHPMIRVSPGDHIATSPKRAALTSVAPLEAAHILAYPGRSADLTQFPARDGSEVDLSHYPHATGDEDFVTLVEENVDGLGWTAVSRARERDIVIFVKDSRVMPVTMLWMSNGGRDYAPWDGRHDGVLGVEDGCAAGAEGHRAALGDNAVAREGVTTALTLEGGRTHVLCHATVVLDQPEGWAGVADIRFEDHEMIVESRSGASLRVPFEATNFVI
ncbi:hypothetical protein [Celeribacter sp. PS-C1]|uniref:hypothetical protein n=1 Tax=Celeribacter sp. PS-C1 TaxID=2820813 RepID=UPI001CA48EF2|nr:hypothetical protein [Celeribacter sp. PS-C1]